VLNGKLKVLGELVGLKVEVPDDCAVVKFCSEDAAGDFMHWLSSEHVKGGNGQSLFQAWLDSTEDKPDPPGVKYEDYPEDAICYFQAKDDTEEAVKALAVGMLAVEEGIIPNETSPIFMYVDRPGVRINFASVLDFAGGSLKTLIISTIDDIGERTATLLTRAGVVVLCADETWDPPFRVRVKENGTIIHYVKRNT
jgi:hypothetical protein